MAHSSFCQVPDAAVECLPCPAFFAVDRCRATKGCELAIHVT